jgi:hypothetical protein
MDDCLFFSPTDETIEDIFKKMWLKEVGLDFNIEEVVADFLGVLMTL